MYNLGILEKRKPCFDHILLWEGELIPKLSEWTFAPQSVLKGKGKLEKGSFCQFASSENFPSSKRTRSEKKGHAGKKVGTSKLVWKLGIDRVCETEGEERTMDAAFVFPHLFSVPPFSLRRSEMIKFNPSKQQKEMLPPSLFEEEEEKRKIWVSRKTKVHIFSPPKGRHAKKPLLIGQSANFFYQRYQGFFWRQVLEPSLQNAQLLKCVDKERFLG